MPPNGARLHKRRKQTREAHFHLIPKMHQLKEQKYGKIRKEGFIGQNTRPDTAGLGRTCRI